MSNESIIRVTANTTDDDIREAVELASGPERLAAYNRATGKDVKKFATKAAGIKQTTRALIEYRDSLEPETTVTEVPLDEAPASDENGYVTENRDEDAVERRLREAERERKGGGAKHDPSKYRSAYVKDQLLAGRLDYETIAEECRERFPHTKTERKHITWYRWKLRKEGYDLA